jgi:hypothetical protein
MARSRYAQDPLPFMAAHERAELLDQANWRIQSAQEEGALWRDKAAEYKAQVDALTRQLAQAQGRMAYFEHVAARVNCLVMEVFAQGLHCLQEHTTARPSAELRKQVTQLITVAHPDKWDNHPCADALTKALVSFRESLERQEKYP